MTSLDTECINGLHEGRGAGEGVPGVGLIIASAGAQAILLGCERGELRPRSVVLHRAPDPLERAPLRAIGGSEESPSGLWKGEPCRRVGPPGVPQAAVQAAREGLRNGVHAQLAQVGVQRGARPAEPLAGRRLPGAIDRGPREDVRDRPHRRPAASGEAPAAHGQEPEAAFVLAEAPDGARVRRWDALLEWGLPGGLERRHGLRMFGCDGAAPLGAWP
jgi:hypothetical protein